MKRANKISVLLGVLVFLFIAVLVVFKVPPMLDKKNNYLWPLSQKDSLLKVPDWYKDSFVADMHCDVLLWNRDILKESSWGHVDLPRLQKGQVGLEIFSVVTKTPRGLNINRNTGATDNNRLLAIAQGWSLRTWNSLLERALYQSEKLQNFAQSSEGQLRLIRTKKDLQNFLADKKGNPKLVGGLLSLEGAHALEGDLKSLNTLYEAGFRMIGAAHFFDNEIAASAHGVSQKGLTPLGVEWVPLMEQKKMIIDLAHSSAQTISDVLKLAHRPVVVSHTGVKGTCNSNRNLSDDQLRALAANGALIGIGSWEEATCRQDIGGTTKAILHALSIVGIEHIALGLDFDGYVGEPFDAAHLGLLAAALQEAGLSEGDIRKIMGENELRFLLENLPE